MSTNHASRTAYLGRNLLSGCLLGIGFVAFIDEAVFHQILHWHHFYDKSTPGIGLVSDGIFHAFSWFSTVAGAFLVSDLRRRNAWWPKRWFGGFLIGGGGFNLFDGTVHHKLMRIHQIRYNVEIAPYDWVWNILAAIMLIAGLMIVFRTGRESKVMEGTA
ncbi:DUF2243 domain-containing protein [Neobacillus sp. 179-C4.2 HS]|uniref:DUF2243 domain-containing protein n=1 Tax=Neobacillus driksii TaxID=3035913 RepID=A0ABV4Z2E9_9BACI|nr:DUF2243 domain-containing protein [Neobacillus sp. 179.-C4.2 HS]MDP5197242.1 DUF2243 domain-containing protein [Neobacillus sp. 179.-C4.2 HS]